ncbi:hypothetical protein [Bordetella genomosp. 1]|nr:hypothetical protein [Bordetella genomosp. 1]MDQ8033722.1 hypothetical protein [Bordetella sp.]
MKRLIAVMLLLFGGLSVEAVRPLQCELIASSQPRARRPGEDERD